MAITSLKTNAFRRSLSSYCQNFTVSFPVGTLQWRNSLLALAQALTRGPLYKGTPPSEHFCSRDRCPKLRQIRPRSALGRREPPGVPLCSHSWVRQTEQSGLDINGSCMGTMSTQSDSSNWEWNAGTLRPRYTHSTILIRSSLMGKKKFEIPLQWYTAYKHLNAAYAARSGI